MDDEEEDHVKGNSPDTTKCMYFCSCTMYFVVWIAQVCILTFWLTARFDLACLLQNIISYMVLN